MNSAKKWYAVYTHPRWEKKTSEILNKKQIETYCPLRKVLRQWADRKKIILEPLFTSYIFINAQIREHPTILQTKGILNFVHWLGKPAIIKDDEIDTIKKFLNEYKNVTVSQIDVNINDNVRIITGPLMFQEGSVLEVRSHTVKVLLPSMGFAMVAEVEKSNLEV